MSENFAEIFERERKSDLKPGNVVHGEVIGVEGEYVIINAGLKSEGIIPIGQFKDEDGKLEVAKGDVVEVILDAIEDGYGKTRLSREKAKRMRIWSELEEAYRESQVVQGTITNKVKGGFTVSLGGIVAFLPGSLVDMRPVRDTSYLEGKALYFKIIKIDQRRNNIVVSRRAVMEMEYGSEREDLVRRLKKGIKVKGIVKNLTDYGAFLDLGGVDGLLHITDMSWRRVQHPSEVVAVGSEIEVQVLEYDREKMRVSLGLKQLDNDPWSEIENKYPKGAKVKGRVTNIADYGCFVEIEDGVEGLVHVSEMNWRSKNIHPEKLVSLGQGIEIMVLGIDHERRRMSLGMKQCKPNPWEEFSKKHEKGDKVSGRIKSITDFGLFVGIESCDVDSLIHMSDLSWNEPGDVMLRKFKKNMEVEAVVLSVDVGRERISLGIKQLDCNKTQEYFSKHGKGSIVEGVVKDTQKNRFRIELADSVMGMLAFSELPGGTAGNKPENVKVDDKIRSKLTGYDKKTNTLLLSVTKMLKDEESKMIREYTVGHDAATASIGDIIKDKTD